MWSEPTRPNPSAESFRPGFNRLTISFQRLGGDQRKSNSRRQSGLCQRLFYENGSVSHRPWEVRVARRLNSLISFSGRVHVLGLEYFPRRETDELKCIDFTEQCFAGKFTVPASSGRELFPFLDTSAIGKLFAADEVERYANWTEANEVGHRRNDR